MINIDNITFSYGEKKVFENFSLNIKKGENICLFGPSGCGKSTLLRLILGLETAQKGEISFEENLKFSVVFQEDRLLPYLNIKGNIEIIGGNFKVAKDILNEFNMLNVANELPKKLSGGMKRRAAITRALSTDFDVLILDEPFTGLDSENIKIAAKEILKYSKEKTIILVTHSLEEANLLNAKIIEI